MGLAVGVGCTLLTSGVGAVACGVLGSALASAITYMIATPEKERSAGGLLLNVGIGAATGAIPLVGKAAAPVVGAAARAAGAAIARTAIGTAIRRGVGAAASGVSIAARLAGSPGTGSVMAKMAGLGPVGRIWASNRALARNLGAEPAQANATVRDLLGLRPGNPQLPWKAPGAQARTDEELLQSVSTLKMVLSWRWMLVLPVFCVKVITDASSSFVEATIRIPRSIGIRLSSSTTLDKGDADFRPDARSQVAHYRHPREGKTG